MFIFNRLTILLITTPLLVYAGKNHSLDTQLTAAIRAQTSVKVRKLIKQGADVNALLNDEKFKSPLHLAAFVGNVTIGRLLLAAGADATCTDHYGCTPLHCAVDGQNSGFVTLLLSESPQAASPKFWGKHSALLILMMAGLSFEHCYHAGKQNINKIDILKALLSHKNMSVNDADKGGDTALHYAVKSSRQIASIKELKNIFVERALTEDDYHICPFADPFITRELVKILLKRGADAHKKNREGKSSLDLVNEMYQDSNTKLLKELLDNNRN